MKKISWSSQMSLGIPMMDEAHKSFVEKLGDLGIAPDSRFCAGWLDLIATLERDFHEEEGLMDKIDFPPAQTHRKQHARVLGALHNLVPEVMRGEFRAARAMIDVFSKWFLFHLETMDAALAAALSSTHRASAPPGSSMEGEPQR